MERFLLQYLYVFIGNQDNISRLLGRGGHCWEVAHGGTWCLIKTTALCYY